MSTKHEVAVELAGGKRLVFETGRMAKQASGAALVTTGETVVLATAVASPDPTGRHRLLPPHRRLPRVHLRRRTHPRRLHQARRPSQREGNPHLPPDRSPHPPALPRWLPQRDAGHRAGLLGRQGKRSRRGRHQRRRCALALSDIPFSATVGAVRVGRVNGEFVINPTYAERAATTVNIMVVGHKDGIVMIESGAKEETEEVILAAIEFAHEEIKKIVAAIDELVAKAGKPKRAFTRSEIRRSLLRRAQGQGRRPPQGRARHQDARQDRELRARSSRSRTSWPPEFPPTIPLARRSSPRTTSIFASGSSASR